MYRGASARKLKTRKSITTDLRIRKGQIIHRMPAPWKETRENPCCNEGLGQGISSGVHKNPCLDLFSYLFSGTNTWNLGGKAANMISLRYSRRTLELEKGTETKKPSTPEGWTRNCPWPRLLEVYYCWFRGRIIEKILSVRLRGSGLAQDWG